MEQSQISLCFVSGAALLMCSLRGTSVHFGALLGHKWRSVYSLDILTSGLQGLEILQSCDQEGGHL